MMTENKISLKSVVGRGYKLFWNFKGRYRVVKGSRGSKKSKTAVLWFIVHIMKHKGANLLVVRKTYRSLKDSCFTELKWAIRRLGVDAFFKIKESPLEIEYIPTGQKIYFRGLDDPLKVTSITVDVGSLCWLWIEECFEISSEADFDMLNESIRGQVEDGLFKQVTLTFNPWSEHHWLKKRFFDKKDTEILAITTNYLCNEFLDEKDFEMYEKMKIDNPRRYQVAGLGNWGIVDGLVFEKFEEREFKIDELRQQQHLVSAFGLDFGYTIDPTAFFCALVDKQAKEIYVFDELYQKGMLNSHIYERICQMGYQKEKIIADHAEPKSIEELRRSGLTRIRKCKKGPDSIRKGIEHIQNYNIIIHPKCKNFIAEINGYTWQINKDGNKINKPVEDNNHLMDAMRYALENIKETEKYSFK